MIFNPRQFPTLKELNANFNVSLPIRGLHLPPDSEVSEIIKKLKSLKNDIFIYSINLN